MGVEPTGGLKTAQMMVEANITLQGKVQDMARQEMAAVLEMVAPPPSHLGKGGNVFA